MLFRSEDLVTVLARESTPSSVVPWEVPSSKTPSFPQSSDLLLSLLLELSLDPQGTVLTLSDTFLTVPWGSLF